MPKIVIRDARLAFPDLFVPVQFQNSGPFSYRATFLIAPDNPAKKEIDAALKEVAKEKWGAKAAAILPTILPMSNKCCFADGNTKAYNGYEGNWALTATRGQDSGRPITVGRGGKTDPITADDAKFFAGCYVNAVVELWAQDNSFGKGLRATLNSVQFVRIGESFGGAAPATADDLDDLGFEDDLEEEMY
jgi:hypothetical protein